MLEVGMYAIGIWLLSFIINLMYYYRKDYKKIDSSGVGDFVFIIFIGPLFCIRNIIAHYEKKKIEYIGEYNWGDYIKYNSREYLIVRVSDTYCVCIETGTMTMINITKEDIEPNFNIELKEQLAIFNRSNQLLKEVRELQGKIKKTYTNK